MEDIDILHLEGMSLQSIMKTRSAFSMRKPPKILLRTTPDANNYFVAIGITSLPPNKMTS